jgi:hypothetical protein
VLAETISGPPFISAGLGPPFVLIPLESSKISSYRFVGNGDKTDDTLPPVNSTFGVHTSAFMGYDKII